jgi:hypothetical protein
MFFKGVVVESLIVVVEILRDKMNLAF